jgi:hypothetical protein
MNIDRQLNQLILKQYNPGSTKDGNAEDGTHRKCN